MWLQTTQTRDTWNGRSQLRTRAMHELWTHMYTHALEHACICSNMLTLIHARLGTQLCMCAHTCTSMCPHILAHIMYNHVCAHVHTCCFAHTHTPGSKQKSSCHLIEHQRDENQLEQKLSSRSLSKMDTQIKGSGSLFTTDPLWAQY